MSLIDDDAPGRNTPEYTVSEISGAVKRTIEGTFGRVRVRGEVGRVMLARSGHLYFDIKDDRSVLAAVSWKGQVARLSIRPEEGMEVIVTGRMTTFGAQSKYQLNVDDVQVAGEGALMAMLEKRKKKLAAEGLFAPERKRPLPFLPEVIGVITSPQGAVIRDILHRLRERFPRHVLIWPVAVQGDACAPQVAAAIEGFNALPEGGPIPRPDLLIVARGGGSVEDLWGFNEEAVARAAAASQIPLISAVGHETDTTLIDYVSDKRAPTPTAAAEIAVPVRLELLGWVEEQGTRLSRAATDTIARRAQRLADLSRALPRAQSLLDSPRQRLDRAGERLPAALRQRAAAARIQLARAGAGLRLQLLANRLADARGKLAAQARRLPPALARTASEKRREYKRLQVRLSSERQRMRIAAARSELALLESRLGRAFVQVTTARRTRLDALERMRQSLGYTETLKRGYAVVRGDGAVVTSKAGAAQARRLEIEFADGRLKLGAAGRARKAPGSPEQGSLF